MSGKLILFSAPSGAGKSTLINHLLTKNFELEFSISATTRSPRGNEIDGKEYYFLSEAEFRDHISKNEFLEYEEVYPGCFYGTLRSEVDRITSKGKNIVFDVDVVGGVNIKKEYGDRLLAVFVAPPSVVELEKRLRGRKTDSEEMIAKRIAKASYELTFAPQFDVTIVNENLEEAKEHIEDALRHFLM